MTIARKKWIPALACCILLCLPLPAEASSKVSSPDVTQGQVELEYRAGYDFDHADNRDGLQLHKFVANYGITSRWRTEIKAIAGGEAGDMDWTFIEWSNRYQLLKDKEGWLKLAIQENYKIALLEDRPDKLEFTVLAAKDAGPFTHIANLNFEKEVGADSTNGLDMNMGWKSKYRLNPRFEPGAEFYADFGRFGNVNTQVSEKYQAGPVFSGKLAEGVKYDIGYLFGINKNVPDGRLKLILTYAFNTGAKP